MPFAWGTIWTFSDIQLSELASLEICSFLKQLDIIHIVFVASKVLNLGLYWYILQVSCQILSYRYYIAPYNGYDIAYMAISYPRYCLFWYHPICTNTDVDFTILNLGLKVSDTGWKISYRMLNYLLEYRTYKTTMICRYYVANIIPWYRWYWCH